MKLVNLLLVLVFVLAMAACSPSAPKNPHKDGKPVAEGSCVSCHGP